MEMAIYQVPVSSKTPEGYRFRCFLVDPANGEELIGMTIIGRKVLIVIYVESKNPICFRV